MYFKAGAKCPFYQKEQTHLEKFIKGECSEVFAFMDDHANYKHIQRSVTMQECIVWKVGHWNQVLALYNGLVAAGKPVMASVCIPISQSGTGRLLVALAAFLHE